MTVTPGFTPAKASVAAGWRSTSCCLSSAGRALSATAAVMYAGIDGAAASDAASSELNTAPAVAKAFMEFLRHWPTQQWRHTLAGRADGTASPRRVSPSPQRSGWAQGKLELLGRNPWLPRPASSLQAACRHGARRCVRAEGA